MNLDELERKALFETVERYPRAAVAGVDDDLERFQPLRVNVAEHVFDVGVEDVRRRALAAGVGFALVSLGQCLDFSEARIRTDRFRRLADELEPVVVGRVMAGRDHDAAVRLEVHDPEIDHLGAAKTDVEHLDAGLFEPPRHGIGKLLARQAHVAPDDDALRVEEFRGRVADAVADVRVELVRNLATDVVGLEAGYRYRHGFWRPRKLVSGVVNEVIKPGPRGLSSGAASLRAGTARRSRGRSHSSEFRTSPSSPARRDSGHRR